MKYAAICGGLVLIGLSFIYECCELKSDFPIVGIVGGVTIGLTLGIEVIRRPRS